MITGFITSPVRVNRKRSPRQMLESTRRQLYVEDWSIVESVPKGEMEEVQISLFKLDLGDRRNSLMDEALLREYDFRDLSPADLYTVAAFNEANPTFADKKPNATLWKNLAPCGGWGFATFERLLIQPSVAIDRNRGFWQDLWWFAGVHK